MINENNFFDYFIKIEPDLDKLLENHKMKWKEESNFHFQVAEMSYFIEEKIAKGDYLKMPLIFERIEYLLKAKNST